LPIHATVRLLLISACVVAMTTAPALACPRGVQCLVGLERTAAPEVARAATQRRVRIPNLRAVRVAPRAHLTFDAPAKRDPSELEMPWIWRVLREQVYAQMPNHRAKRFSLTMAPVVVTTPAETVPGVGVAGDF
jgi:hypothetical protein